MVEWTEELVSARIERRRRSRPRFVDDFVTLAHGAGGKASRALVEGLILPHFEPSGGGDLGDAALLGHLDGELAFTTDTFVVTPLQFPGGSIGELAVHGTVNDLAVSGARAVALSVALVLEEGLRRETLKREIEALAAAAASCEVRIVCGDTKVVERGKADGLYINTSGIGVLDPRSELDPVRIAPGDRMLVSGTVGDHGVAVMLARGELDLVAPVCSDTCSLWPPVEALLGACGAAVRCMRDATRGGVATVANEMVIGRDVGVVIDEAALPMVPAVTGACELLGIDPLYVANEGKLVAFVAPEAEEAALAALQDTEAGRRAATIGTVVDDPPGRVLGRTTFGGHRMIDFLVGDPLPRIC